MNSTPFSNNGSKPNVMTGNRHLDPRALDPEALDPKAYHAIVGPALQTAAEVAADRGDPTLAADMPAMLALIDLITCLAGDYDGRTGYALDDLVNGAPAAACVMVMQEAKLGEEAIGQCLAALEAAYAQLAEHGVTAPARELISQGGRRLRQGERAAGLAYLKQATQKIVAAIEDWQKKVH